RKGSTIIIMNEINHHQAFPFPSASPNFSASSLRVGMQSSSSSSFKKSPTLMKSSLYNNNENTITNKNISPKISFEKQSISITGPNNNNNNKTSSLITASNNFTNSTYSTRPSSLPSSLTSSIESNNNNNVIYSKDNDKVQLGNGKKLNFDEVLILMKQVYQEEQKTIKEELLEYKHQFKESQKQVNLLEYRLKTSTSRIEDLEKKVKEAEEQKTQAYRKYYDLKKDFDELVKFKQSIVHMVSPNSKEKLKVQEMKLISSPHNNLNNKNSQRFDGSRNMDIVGNSVNAWGFNDKNNSLLGREEEFANSFTKKSTVMESNPILTSYQENDNFKTPRRSRSVLSNGNSSNNKNVRSSALKDNSSILSTGNNVTNTNKTVTFSPSTKGEEKRVEELMTETLDTYRKLSSAKKGNREVGTPPKKKIHQEIKEILISESTNPQPKEEQTYSNMTAEQLYGITKKSLLPEEFKEFTGNIRKLNSGDQSVSITLQNIKQILGEERKFLFDQLKRVIESTNR
ncbi:hypothetical protein ABK040_002772, partial [Willaertia magna]